MKINDVIYGEEEISEPVLSELIHSDSIQRLKGISQWGIPQEFHHVKGGYSRYEHSVGVLILLRKLGASLEEQIAGLLHDISHHTFSHLIDWVVGDPTKEDHQDNTFSEFMENSKIPEILRSHGFNFRDFLELEKFPLLEKEAPSLCADRVDYTLRDLVIWEPELAKKLFNDLINYERNIVFSSSENAELFAEKYRNFQKYHWAEVETRTRYHVFAIILKKALEDNLLNLEDFKKTEDHVLRLLIQSDNKEISETLDLLRNSLEFNETEGEGGILLKKKFRYIDPEILVGNSIVCLSKFSLKYAKILQEEKRNSLNEVRVIISDLK